MNPEKQKRLESNNISMNTFYLITKQNQFLCFSEENDNYYLSESENSDLVIITSPQKEQETIKLYQTIIGVFLTPVSNRAINESYRKIQQKNS